MRILSVENAYMEFKQLPNNVEMRFLPIKSDTSKTKTAINGLKGKDTIEAKKAKLREASKDFEAIFARQILKSMRSTLTDGGMFGEGATGEIFSDMMDNAIAEKIAERGELGLADAIYKQTVKSIEHQDSSVTNTALEK